MITIFVSNSHALFHQIFVNRFAPSQSHTMIRPRRTFGLKIETRQVSSHKSRFRGTIAMEAHMVEPIRFASLKHLHPRLHIGWRVARVGEVAVLHRTTQENLFTIQIEHLIFYFHLTHAKHGFFPISLPIRSPHFYLQSIQLRMELIPKKHIIPHLKSDVTIYCLHVTQNHLFLLTFHHMLLVRIECRRLHRHRCFLVRFAIQHLQMNSCRLTVNVRINRHIVNHIERA